MTSMPSCQDQQTDVDALLSEASPNDCERSDSSLRRSRKSMIAVVGLVGVVMLVGVVCSYFKGPSSDVSRKDLEASHVDASATLLASYTTSTSVGNGYADWRMCGRSFFSNLGGGGPDKGRQELRVYDVIEYQGAKVDLVVTNETLFKAWRSQQTGVAGCTGVISMGGETSTKFKFKFVWAANNTPVTFGDFFVTIMSLNGRSDGSNTEKITFNDDLNKVFLAPDSYLKESGSLQDQNLTFTSNPDRDDAPYPDNPMELSVAQERISVSVEILDASEWLLTYTLKGGKGGGRVFQFAGMSSLVDVTPLPTETPTAEPTPAPPTYEPSPAPTETPAPVPTTPLPTSVPPETPVPTPMLPEEFRVIASEYAPTDSVMVLDWCFSDGSGRANPCNGKGTNNVYVHEEHAEHTDKNQLWRYDDQSRIVVDRDHSMCLTVDQETSSNVYASTCTGDDYQIWDVTELQSGSAMQIKWRKNGICLDCCKDNKDSCSLGTTNNVYVRACNGEAWQSWRWVPLPTPEPTQMPTPAPTPEIFRVILSKYKPTDSAMVLDWCFSDGSGRAKPCVADNVYVHKELAEHTDKNQLWRYDDQSRIVVDRDRSMCLTVDRETSSNVGVSTCTDDEYQTWDVTELQSGIAMQIKWKKNGLCLDWCKGNKESCSLHIINNVYVRACNGEAWQSWQWGDLDFDED